MKLSNWLNQLVTPILRVFIIFLMLPLPGIAAPQLYKPGASPEETKALVAGCQLEASKSTASMDPITYGRTQRQADILGLGKLLVSSLTEYNIFSLCLKAKGFTDGSAVDSNYSRAKYNLPSDYQAPLSVQVEIPSYVEEGGLVPINVALDGIDLNDAVESISVIIDSNPVEHRHALTVQYMRAPSKVALSTRVRLADSAKQLISAIITFRSGKSVTKQFAPNKVAKTVDFNLPDTLVPIVTTTAKLFSSEEIGQQRARIGTDGFLSTIIYHPMFPAIGGRRPLLLEQLVVKNDSDDDVLLVALGDALSNNPLIRVHTGDISGKVVWNGSAQTKFETKIVR